MGDEDFDDLEGLSGNQNDGNGSYFYMTSSDFFFDDTDKELTEQEKTADSYNTTLSSLLLNTSRDIHVLNGQKAASFWPIFIVLGIITVLGVLCHTLVCYIYRCRSRRSTSNFFFIFFAIFDIVGCLLGIPAEILDLALPYLYDIEPLCKFMGFLKTWIVCGLCLTLICVSFDCYKKLCRPNEEFGVRKAKISCGVVVFIAFIFSVPSLFVYGTKEVLTTYPGVFGKTCAVDPSLPDWLHILHYGSVLFPFTVSLCAMSVFYCLIGVWYCKQRQAADRGKNASPVKRAFPKTHRFVKEETSSSSIQNEEFNRLCSPKKMTYSPKAVHSDPARAPLKTSNVVNKSGRPPASNSSISVQSNAAAAVMPLHVKTTKQALIFLVISLIFVLFMLPFIVVTTLLASTDYFDEFSSNGTEIGFNFCVRSYFLNYLVKPIVYLICNGNFRTEVNQLFHKIWALCTRSASEQATSRQLQRSLTMSSPRSTSRTPIYRPPPNSV